MLYIRHIVHVVKLIAVLHVHVHVLMMLAGQLHTVVSECEGEGGTPLLLLFIIEAELSYMYMYAPDHCIALSPKLQQARAYNMAKFA